MLVITEDVVMEDVMMEDVVMEDVVMEDVMMEDVVMEDVVMEKVIYHITVDCPLLWTVPVICMTLMWLRLVGSMRLDICHLSWTVVRRWLSFSLMGLHPCLGMSEISWRELRKFHQLSFLLCMSGYCHVRSIIIICHSAWVDFDLLHGWIELNCLL